ncbi:MAG: YHYH protein [Rhodothermales bacterium]
MKSSTLFKYSQILIIALLTLIACDSGSNSDEMDDENLTPELAEAFSAFDETNVTIMLDGDQVLIESNGLPNHTSPYWSNTTERSAIDPMGNMLVTAAAASNHPLFSEPAVTSFESMAPGNIDDFNGSYALTIPASPALATNSSATGLGAIGIAVSGSMIYNDQEGPNVPLDNAAPSLDYNGAHTGPQSYHYHLEPVAWSEDDDNLIGVMADGFFLYGRKCTSTGTYPTGLDASGGHTSTTKYNDETEYHYHIENELYLNQYYILFPGDYQGSANAIN